MYTHTHTHTHTHAHTHTHTSYGIPTFWNAFGAPGEVLLSSIYTHIYLYIY